MCGNRQEHVFAFLENPATHDGVPVKRVDTHAAVVFLAGECAYKVKRALKLPYMDLSTRELRHTVCLAELSINQTYAPHIYRGVIAVTEDADGNLQIGGEGRVVEWMVLMRRFDESQTLDHLAERGALSAELMCQLAQKIAATHQTAPVFRHADVTGNLLSYIQDNTRAFRQAGKILEVERMLRFSADMQGMLQTHADLLHRRCALGTVRRCHGDLHLRNLAMIDGEVTPFDAIEFDESIATIDILYDLAFLLMDLLQRGLRAEANLLFNRYLWEMRNDSQIDGIPLLPFFIGLRAAIRAKVAVDTVPHLHGAALAACEAEMKRYADFAIGVLAPAPARLVAVGGLSGTGKSSVAKRLAAQIGRGVGAVHLRSDLQRKQMFNVVELDRLPEAAYTPDASAQVYARLRDKAERILRAGDSVVVDAVYLTEAERADIAGVAARAGAAFSGIWLEAPEDVRFARVERRTDDASDATGAVVHQQEGLNPGDITWARVDARQALSDVVRDAQAAIQG